MASRGGVHLDSFAAIDFQQRHDRVTVDSVAQLIRKFGAVRVRNHGLAPSILSELFDMARTFFDSPLSMKATNPFYLPFGNESVRGEVTRKETLDFDTPLDVDKIPAPFTRFIKELSPIVTELVVLISTALDLSSSFSLSCAISDARPSLHYYPAGFGKDRNPAHQDYNALTLLFQHNLNGGQGLQVADLSSTTRTLSATVNETATFLHVDPHPDELIVMIGHTFSKWVRANSPPERRYFTPCVHKVSSVIDLRDDKTPPRYSLAHFVYLTEDTWLGEEMAGDYVNRLKLLTRQV